MRKPVDWSVLTPEHLEEWRNTVENLIEARRQAGSLLSVMDVIATGATLYAVSNNLLYVPASWIFAWQREDDHPSGLAEEVSKIRRAVKELDEIMAELAAMQKSLEDLGDKRRQILKQLDAAEAKIQEAKRDGLAEFAAASKKAKRTQPKACHQ